MMTRKIAATISAVLLHLAVGSVYAWSVVVAPIMEETGWSQLQVTIVFGVTLLFLGFSTLLFSDKIKKAGPQKSCATAFALFLAGMLISTVAVPSLQIRLFFSFLYALAPLKYTLPSDHTGKGLK